MKERVYSRHFSTAKVSLSIQRLKPGLQENEFVRVVIVSAIVSRSLEVQWRSHVTFNKQANNSHGMTGTEFATVSGKIPMVSLHRGLWP